MIFPASGMPALSSAIRQTDFNLPGQTAFYRGKVRDVYTIDDRLLVMVASDRISAFDVVLPRAIPGKGQVLNQIAAHFLAATRDLVPNWVLEHPNPRVTVGIKTEPVRVEMVIRGYLTGHAWREYSAGKRALCGITLPAWMREHDPFPQPIITPATKADEGHDLDISREEILKQELVPEEVYLRMEEYTRQLFERGTAMARERGLILVDTKYEFGMAQDGRLLLIDEIHTPDSSRYFYLDGYQERRQKGEPQKQLSKEFVREWLMSGGFQGKTGQVVPEMTDVFVETVAARYIELFERITGQPFLPADSTADLIKGMEQDIILSLGKLR